MKKTNCVTAAALIGCTVLSTGPAMASLSGNTLAPAMCETLQGQSCGDAGPLTIHCAGYYDMIPYANPVLTDTTCVCDDVNDAVVSWILGVDAFWKCYTTYSPSNQLRPAGPPNPPFPSPSTPQDTHVDKVLGGAYVQ
jgi:hypothetical protein